MLRLFRQVNVQVQGDGTSSVVTGDLRDMVPLPFGAPALASPPQEVVSDANNPAIESVETHGYKVTITFTEPPPEGESNYNLRLFYQE